MKKILLGSTALVAAGMLAGAGEAQAQGTPIAVTVGGYFYNFVGFVDQDDRKGAGAIGKPANVDQQNDGEIWFSIRGQLANGMVIGGRVELEAQTEGDQIDETYLFAEGGFGRFELGQINNVAYRMQYRGPNVGSGFGHNEGNVVNWVVNSTRSPLFDSALNMTGLRFGDNDANKINYYTPRFAGFQFGVSYIPELSQDREGIVPNESDGYNQGFAAGANYVQDFGTWRIAAALGYVRYQAPDGSPNDDPYGYSAGLQLGFGGLTVGGSYMRVKDGRSAAGSCGFGAGTATAGNTSGTATVAPGCDIDGEAWDVGVQYVSGPASVSLSYLHGTNKGTIGVPGEDKHWNVTLVGRYTLAPGIALMAALFHAEFNGKDAGSGFDNEGTGVVGGLLLNF